MVWILINIFLLSVGTDAIKDGDHKQTVCDNAKVNWLMIFDDTIVVWCVHISLVCWATPSLLRAAKTGSEGTKVMHGQTQWVQI